jgi:hypothetical protein
MKLADAPPAGWYPDPQGGVRLRWWDGSDWTDRYRARPSAGLDGAVSAGPASQLSSYPGSQHAPGVRGVDTADIIAQVRQAARAEVDRAADLFSARVRGATRDLQPLITAYTSKVLRWIKIAALIAVLLVVAWILFQVIAQVSIFEWIGDRVDNLTSKGAVQLPT